MPEFDRTKWDAKYADPDFAPREPSAVLMALDNFLPKQGRAIDVAGGAGVRRPGVPGLSGHPESPGPSINSRQGNLRPFLVARNVPVPLAQ